MKAKVCELCNGEASVFCVSDSAFLCWSCDARVHEANFLVARHVRCTICRKCHDFDGNRFSGVGLRLRKAACRCCSSLETEEISSDSSSSCSSTCISTSESTQIKRRQFPAKFATSNSVSENSGEKLPFPTKIFIEKNRKRVEGILVNWGKKLGLKGNYLPIGLALNAFDVGMRRLTFLPFRVNLASAFWLSLNVWKKNLNLDTCRILKKLEGISGVPTKLILLGEKKIARVLKTENRDEKDEVVDLEEGWAECSD